MEKEKKVLLQEIDEYKFKSYNVLNDNVSLKKKIKSLNNTILDRDIEIKTVKQDKEKYMAEVIDLNVKLKQLEKEENEMKAVIEELKQDSLAKLSKAKIDMDVVTKKYAEINEQIQNYKKFVKDMNGVIKILIKGSSDAIEVTKEIPELNTDKNQ